MQYFGQYINEFDEEFLTQSYLYFKKEGEEDLTIPQFTELIKNSGFTPVERDSLYNEIKVW